MNARVRTGNEGVPDCWEVTDADRQLAARLQQRLPARIVDAHLHLYRPEDVAPRSALLDAGPDIAGIACWRDRIGEQLGRERLAGALCTPMPSRDGDLNSANEFVVGQVQGDAALRATVLVSAASTPDELSAWIDDPKVVGFKPYHFYAPRDDTYNAAIPEFIPECVWKLADERGLLILLHLVKDRALSDPQNIEDIRQYCRRYPGAQLVLAHAARGFHAPNTVNAIAELRGLENIWFDCSAICESAALVAVLDEFGPRRLLWGSDFPVSHQRGRCVTLGNGFVWVTTDQVQWNERAFFGQPVPVGLESLRAVFEAGDRVGLANQDYGDIFAGNAERLLGQRGPSSESPLTAELYRRAKELIPGGTQLLSKRPEMFAPGQWPAYFAEARGCEVWDLDGRRYLDLSVHGIGAALLGFRDPDVTRAVKRRLNLGSFSTLNPPDEVELAQLLCQLHPWAENVRFARTGGEAMSVAARIARATTDRSLVAVCGYHGWHDWYLAANLGEEDALRGHLLPGLEPLGVPRELRGTLLTFTYNDRDALRQIISQHGSRLAAVVMEPCRHHDPEPGFLEFVREAAHDAGALVVFDEITIGWRLELGGAHLRYGVAPDIAVFSKALGNGHPVAAIIGTGQAMEGAHSSFISSTYWTEGIGPAAALATVRKMQRVDVRSHCATIGGKAKQTWRRLAEKHALPVEVEDGFPALATFSFAHPAAQELRTLYTQEMLKRGFLAGTSLYVCLAHTEDVLEQYGAAADEAFAEIADAIEKGDIAARLQGPVAHTGFRRLL